MKTKQKIFSFILVAVLLLAGARAIPQEGDYKYIASKRSQVYHELTCEWAQKIAPGNRVYFRTMEEAEASGRRACKVCRPSEARAVSDTTPKKIETEARPQAESVSSKSHQVTKYHD